MVFNFLNFPFGVFTFVLVVTLSSLSVGLLPLCCCGVLVFFLTCLAVDGLVLVDMQMATRIQSSFFVHRNRVRLIPSSEGLRSFAHWKDAISIRVLTTLVYFCTIKFALSILGFVIACVQISLFAWVFYPVVFAVCMNDDTCVDDEGRNWAKDMCIGASDNYNGDYVCHGIRIDTLVKSFVYTFIGFVLGLLFTFVSTWTARMHASITIACLSTASDAIIDTVSVGLTTGVANSSSARVVVAQPAMGVVTGVVVAHPGIGA